MDNNDYEIIKEYTNKNTDFYNKLPSDVQIRLRRIFWIFYHIPSQLYRRELWYLPNFQIVE